jgi:prepilin-type N-terminal cleavage/methylation domain-containing protein/prepilin-type processing-associated H-X9-DG protein
MNRVWPRMSRRCARRAFTLIELLVVVAILAMLIALLLPSLARARDQTKAVVCATHLKELGNATAAWLTEAQKSNAQGALGWGTQALRMMQGQTGVFTCPTDSSPVPRPAVNLQIYEEPWGRVLASCSMDGIFSRTTQRRGDWVIGIEDTTTCGIVYADFDYDDVQFDFRADAGQRPSTVDATVSLSAGHFNFSMSDWRGRNSVRLSGSRTVQTTLMWGSYGLSASGALPNQPASSILLCEASDWAIWPENLDELRDPAYPKQNKTAEQLRKDLQMPNGGYVRAAGPSSLSPAETYMRLAPRHGGTSTVAFQDVVWNKGFQPRARANTGFQDGHVESLDQGALLGKITKWHPLRRPGWAVTRF